MPSTDLPSPRRNRVVRADVPAGAGHATRHVRRALNRATVTSAGALALIGAAIVLAFLAFLHSEPSKGDSLINLFLVSGIGLLADPRGRGRVTDPALRTP